MACGTPVVCTNASSLPEVASGAARMVEPGDTGAWVASLAGVLTDHHAAEDLRRRGLARAAEFTWARTAQGVLDAYRTATALQGGRKRGRP
jgi:alpha-1,3-rhamnosyl/mannosyltransferase